MSTLRELYFNRYIHWKFTSCHFRTYHVYLVCGWTRLALHRSWQVESSPTASPPLDAILDGIPSHDKTLTFAKRILKNHPNNKLNKANQSMTKNLAKTASHNFSTRGTTFPHRISQSSSTFIFSLSISSCTPFLSTHLSLHCISPVWRQLGMSQIQKCNVTSIKNVQAY